MRFIKQFSCVMASFFAGAILTSVGAAEADSDRPVIFKQATSALQQSQQNYGSDFAPLQADLFIRQVTLCYDYRVSRRGAMEGRGIEQQFAKSDNDILALQALLEGKISPDHILTPLQAASSLAAVWRITMHRLSDFSRDALERLGQDNANMRIFFFNLFGIPTEGTLTTDHDTVQRLVRVFAGLAIARPIMQQRPDTETKSTKNSFFNKNYKDSADIMFASVPTRIRGKIIKYLRAHEEPIFQCFPFDNISISNVRSHFDGLQLSRMTYGMVPRAVFNHEISNPNFAGSLLVTRVEQATIELVRSPIREVYANSIFNRLVAIFQLATVNDPLAEAKTVSADNLLGEHKKIEVLQAGLQKEGFSLGQNGEETDVLLMIYRSTGHLTFTMESFHKLSQALRNGFLHRFGRSKSNMVILPPSPAAGSPAAASDDMMEPTDTNSRSGSPLRSRAGSNHDQPGSPTKSKHSKAAADKSPTTALPASAPSVLAAPLHVSLVPGPSVIQEVIVETGPAAASAGSMSADQPDVLKGGERTEGASAAAKGTTQQRSGLRGAISKRPLLSAVMFGSTVAIASVIIWMSRSKKKA